MIFVLTEPMYNTDLAKKLAQDLGLDCCGLTLYMGKRWVLSVMDALIIFPEGARFEELREKARRLPYLKEIKGHMELQEEKGRLFYSSNTLH